jgi:hypothetical protein
MAYQLSFEKLAEYDTGKSGVTMPVTLSFTDVSVTFDAKLDTGSSECVFARRYGEQLGLEIEDGERIRIGTATGSFIAYRHELTLTVLGYDFDSHACFASDEFFNRNVLGRHGFMDRVQIGLNDYDGKLYLNRYEPE